MMTLNRPFQIARRSLALTALLTAGMVVAHAQQATPATDTTAAVPMKTLDFKAPVVAPEVNFSSSADNQVAALDNPFAAVTEKSLQPPPRRSYGRPRYRGGNTNADGSAKYAFVVGGGFGQPLGNTYHYLTPSWGLEVGGGRNFNRNFGVLAQFDWDNFGFNGRTLGNQQNLYNQIISYYNVGVPANQQAGLISGLDGHTHVWSITVNPTYTFSSNAGLGGYIVGAAGFYHKVADFTVPAVGTYCDYYYGCYQYQANQVIDHYTSNAPGVNGGFGITYKTSRFSNAKLFAEVRYVYIFNSQRQGVTISNVNAVNAAAYNDFPANSNRTSYLPVKFGLRF